MQPHIENLRRKDCWICYHCIDSLDTSRAHFELDREDAKAMQEKMIAQIFIAKRRRGFNEKRLYRKVRDIIMRIQIWFRIRKRKKAFLHQVRSACQKNNEYSMI